ncbi:glycosyltransferase [Virgibacillus sp. C22-A2]|uniref:Glycosyltransferase n=1 Tax=Virgibacillus tibetensis TaxID=3042313 RepID=A0ABU6KLY5_9BACI|nr:glycosyltransferase [Virgibacillus sp. C22-A2]
MFTQIKKIITVPLDWLLYTVLNEKQRKFLTDRFSDEQKEKLKRLINGKKQVQRQKLKQIKSHLYNLGFTKRGLSELEDFYYTTKDAQLKRLAAWELTLWHVNKYNTDGAEQALEYIAAAITGEKDDNQLRRAAIIRAECLETLNQKEEGKRVLKDMLTFQKHPDLYLALSNLEESIEEREKWINKAMDFYGIQPVFFSSNTDEVIYDDLKTVPTDTKIENGPKVSVILPAYKAETGIVTAIESILSQTWQNIELLIVDDCSPDNTVSVVKEYMEKDSRIKLFTTPVNSGPYIARNIALKEAAGEYVTINDSDDWSHSQKIEKQVQHLIENKHIIANTSEHARLTEELKLYRRGTPGKYIFPNMSSIMFRRAQVIEKVGFWDSVRFAADGEFKRRLIKVFGKHAYVDLKTGPLSLPRQSVSSLTGSSAFGYNGFFMGVRKEYVESFEFYHKHAETLYYPFPQVSRPYSVPEPMWPKREEKLAGNRHFDIVIASDYRIVNAESAAVKEIHKHAAAGKRIGLIQMYHYNLNAKKEMTPEVRKLIDGNQVQMLVYGEKITSDVLTIINPIVLENWQKYIPTIEAKTINVIVNEIPVVSASKRKLYELKDCVKHMHAYFSETGTWYPIDTSIRESLVNYVTDDLHLINLASEDWENRSSDGE